MTPSPTEAHMNETVTDSKTRVDYQMPGMWRIIFLNDDFTPMQFVVQVLISIFNKSMEDATVIMEAVHQEGKAAVGIYTKEVASNKVEMTLALAYANEHPLLVYPEPIP